MEAGESGADGLREPSVAIVSNCTGHQLMPTAGILLDFQLSRYAPPALDVLTVITLGSVLEFRNNHLTALLNIYYDALGEELDQNNLRIAQILPRINFDASCDHYHLAGLIENCLFNMTILVPMEIAKPLMDGSAPFDDFIRDEQTKVRLIVESFEIDATFRYRFTDIMSEIIDKYILM